MAASRFVRGVVVGALALGLTPPASASSVSGARRRQAELRAGRARVAGRLDAARASDRQLQAAVRDLDAHIVAQQAGTEAARQAAGVARQALSDTRLRLEATRQRTVALHEAVKLRAIAAYVQPSGAMLADVLAADDLNEATRRQELLGQVVGSGRTDLERLRAAQDDLGFVQRQLDEAEQAAALRRRQAEARLAALRYARSQQARLRSALDQRVREYLAEADAMAKEETTLVAFLNSHAVAAAAPPRSPRARAAAGPSSVAGVAWPVRGPVTSGFGSRWGRRHEGIDIGAGSGTPIHAAKSGAVIFSGTRHGYGNVVIVDHGGGFTTLYAHQSRRAASVGQTVSQGEVIGYVGSTGHATGPHLHFETRVNGAPRNPAGYL